MTQAKAIKSENENKPNYVLWIIVGLLILSAIVVISLISDDNLEEKPILYKYDVETYDYGQIKDKLYEIEYSYTKEGLRNKASIQIWLYKAGNCAYHLTNSNNYATVGVDSLTCTYSINNGELVFNAKVKNNTTQAQEDLNITGTFDTNYKTLTIGNLNYHIWEYKYYLKNHMSYILVDPTTNKAYDVDGSRDVGYTPEQLDLTEYQIVDLSKNDSDE